MATRRNAPRAQGLEVLRFVPYNLRCLAAAGTLTEDAHSLALQLIAKMRAEQSLTVKYTLAEACRTIVFANGKPLLGPVGSDMLGMIGAITIIHQHLGFLNHFDEVALQDAHPDWHFISDPCEHWDAKSLATLDLTFQFDCANMDYYSEAALQGLRDAQRRYATVEVAL
jgi:hypothetical protein